MQGTIYQTMRLALVVLMPAMCIAQGVITTVAGNGANATAGDGGPATSASLRPNGVAVDNAGNIYIADLAKSVIRKVNDSGIITTFAGRGDGVTTFSGDNGPATSASIYLLNSHNGIAVDAAGNVYIADDGHHRIRKVDPLGIITTFAGNGKQGFSGDGGPATQASLYRPTGVTFDRAGNLYIADSDNGRIRKVDTSGIITTVAGSGIGITSGDSGPALTAVFTPADVAVDSAGNIYIDDEQNSGIRKVNTAGIISTVAGGTFGFSGDGGPGSKASLSGPRGIALDAAGNLYIADYGNHRIRKVDLAGNISTVAGGGSGVAEGGPPTSATMLPAGITFDSAGNYYIADLANNRIRKVIVGATVPGLSSSASSLYFSYVANASPPSAQVVTVYTLGPAPLGFTLSTQSQNNFLNASFSGGATPVLVTVSVQGGVPAGIYNGNVILTPVAPGLPQLMIPVTLNVNGTAPARPAITANGVVNGASFKPGVAPNSWATISGTNLASTSTDWGSLITSGKLPASLGNVTVLFGGKPAYLSYVSPSQVNVLIPDVAIGTTQMAVNNTGSVALPFNVNISTYAPAFFQWQGTTQPVATHNADYSYVAKDGTFAGLPTVAAKPGEVIILWGTGFGPTTPAAPLGIPTPSDRIYGTPASPTVTINNVSATVYGAALAPGFAGLFQVAIQVPDSLPDGDWPIVASIGGVQSPAGIVLSVKR